MWRLIAGAGCAVLLAGCGFLPSSTPHECTQIGCSSGVTFNLEHDVENGIAYEIEACVDDRCEAATISVGFNAEGPNASANDGSITLDVYYDYLFVDLGRPGDYRGTHRVALTVRDESGEVLADVDQNVEFQPNQPNGPDCPPLCWGAVLEV